VIVPALDQNAAPRKTASPLLSPVLRKLVWTLVIPISNSCWTMDSPVSLRTLPGKRAIWIPP